jgi:hypothetical protein
MKRCPINGIACNTIFKNSQKIYRCHKNKKVVEKYGFLFIIFPHIKHKFQVQG